MLIGILCYNDKNIVAWKRKEEDVVQASFSYNAKSELTSVAVKNGCCRRAMAFGLIYGASIVDGTICVSFSHEDVSALFGAVAKEAFGKETAAEVKTVVGRKTYEHRFSSKRAIAYLGALDGEMPVNFSHLVNFKCGGCRQCFLRGIFLALGTVTDPAKAFHLEMMLNSSVRADKLDELLALCGIPARRLDRKGRIGLYYKNSTSIEEFFAETGANSVLFELMNVKIEKEIRNQENRATNCVARNISRSVDAIQKQVGAIERLRDHGVLDGLPEDLRATAELRLRYDEASLSELAEKHSPPISKSGLNHRLEKLMELSEKIK